MIYRVMYTDETVFSPETFQAFFRSKVEAEDFVFDLEHSGHKSHVSTDRSHMPQNQRQLIQLLTHWGNP